MKIAFFILAHRYPEQLDRLVGRLPPDSPVFVHFDARAELEVYAQAESLLSRRANVRFVRRFRCYWGAMSIVHATLECIGALIAAGHDFDYAMLLSGQDYPIKDPAHMRRFLEAHRGREFIESFRLAEPNRWTLQGGSIQAMRRVEHLHLRLRSRVLSVPMRRRFPRGLTPHGGSQWWCLSADCVRFVHRFTQERPDVLRFFERVSIPDESFFQSVLSASPFAGNMSHEDLMFAVWDRPEPPHPATLGTHDLPALQRSPKLFARKFDMMRDGLVLDLIDSTLLDVEPERPLPLSHE